MQRNGTCRFAPLDLTSTDAPEQKARAGTHKRLRRARLGRRAAALSLKHVGEHEVVEIGTVSVLLE